MASNLFLTGFMGTGKSAVGGILAHRLGWRFVDLDREIEAAAGLTVAEIFERRGEAEFRERERSVLEQVSRRSRAVVATGGGIVLDERNRRTLRASGKIVCLTADVATILDRVGGGDVRPLLAGAIDRAERVRALLDSRAAAYADADRIVDTRGKTVGQVADEIAAWLAADAIARGDAPAPGPARG